MHLENIVFASDYTNPTVTTLPDIQCQNSPTMTTVAQTFEQVVPNLVDDTNNFFTFHTDWNSSNFQYVNNYFEQNCPNFPPNNGNRDEFLPVESKIWNDQHQNQTKQLIAEDHKFLVLKSDVELTEEQLDLERQFTTAFFDSAQIDQNYDPSLFCDFEQPIEQKPIIDTSNETTPNCSQENRNCSPFFLAPPFKPFSSPTHSDEISLSELSPLNLIENSDDNLSDKDINFDIQNELSNSSFSFDVFAKDMDDNEIEVNIEETIEEKLPSICSTFGKNFNSLRPQISTGVHAHFSEINNFLRNSSATSIELFNHEQSPQKNAYGHLLSAQPVNNNLSETENQYTIITEDCPIYRDNPIFYDNNCLFENQVVLTQNDAILGTADPFLSAPLSTTTHGTAKQNLDNFTLNFDRHLSEISIESATTDYSKSIESENDTVESDVEENEPGECFNAMQCKWAECYQHFYGEAALVKHIEKMHVELKRGDEFSCFWENCPRKIKPFNARYKLLIHMRVHSGEKPNKCSWPGCNKAFSRLENLKIHQRSHTGERPYKCQHAGCHKAFSNSSDRAKHQRTHVDTKPYACQVLNCLKRYTDPSSLRKHIKNHSLKEQAYVKKRQKNAHNIVESDSVTNSGKLTTNETCQTQQNHGGKNDMSQTDWSKMSPEMKQRNSIKMDLKNKIMNDKVRKMNKTKQVSGGIEENLDVEILNSFMATMENSATFLDSEFIPYESVQRLFNDKLGEMDI